MCAVNNLQKCESYSSSSNSGRDITPCHTWHWGSYQYTGNCGGQYPLNPGNPPISATWDATNGCSTGMNFAALNWGVCGNWWGGPGSEVLISSPPLDDHLPSGGNVDAFYDATHDGGLFDDSFASASHQSALCAGTGEDKSNTVSFSLL